MRNILAAVVALALLGGCQQHTAAELDAQDDSHCRAQIGQRSDHDPNAYQGCRNNLQTYRAAEATANREQLARIAKGLEGMRDRPTTRTVIIED